MSQETIQELANRVERFVEERGWGKYHNPRDIAIALSVEAAELLEIFQWAGVSSRIDREKVDRIRMETADTVIYALSMANACGFDLGEAISEKIELNEKKYPAGQSQDLFDK